MCYALDIVNAVHFYGMEDKMGKSNLFIQRRIYEAAEKYDWIHDKQKNVFRKGLYSITNENLYMYVREGGHHRWIYWKDHMISWVRNPKHNTACGLLFALYNNLLSHYEWVSESDTGESGIVGFYSTKNPYKMFKKLDKTLKKYDYMFPKRVNVSNVDVSKETIKEPTNAKSTRQHRK
jgi:hypothetical protein